MSELKPQLYSPGHKITVRQSPGKGRGVFTTRRIRAGEVIEAAPVLLIPKSQADVITSTFLGHYVFQSDNKKHYVIGLGLTSMINRGKPANADFSVSIDSIVIKALRAIASGVEVTIDYGWRAEEWELVGVKYSPPE